MGTHGLVFGMGLPPISQKARNGWGTERVSKSAIWQVGEYFWGFGHCCTVGSWV
jgi:hypothetical protein